MPGQPPRRFVLRVVVNDPKPWQRVRVGVVQPKRIGAKARAHFYHPDDDGLTAYKQEVAARCKTARPAGWPMDAAYEVDLFFILPCYDGASLARRWHTRVPDKDNYTKAVYDALKNVLWKDDCQVVDGREMKVQAACDEKPHVVIIVRVKEAQPGLDSMF